MLCVAWIVPAGSTAPDNRTHDACSQEKPRVGVGNLRSCLRPVVRGLPPTKGAVVSRATPSDRRVQIYPYSKLHGRRNTVALLSTKRTNAHRGKNTFSTSLAQLSLTILSHAKRTPRERPQRHHRQPELQYVSHLQDGINTNRRQ